MKECPVFGAHHRFALTYSSDNLVLPAPQQQGEAAHSEENRTESAKNQTTKLVPIKGDSHPPRLLSLRRSVPISSDLNRHANARALSFRSGGASERGGRPAGAIRTQTAIIRSRSNLQKGSPKRLQPSFLGGRPLLFSAVSDPAAAGHYPVVLGGGGKEKANGDFA
ncbi:hypothetical protein NL676_024687 [Syzygium grande]|nr:hypothetical protein NL676_024687 [Syzygium grande]